MEANNSKSKFNKKNDKAAGNKIFTAAKGAPKKIHKTAPRGK